MSWDEIDRISDDQLTALEIKIHKLYSEAVADVSQTINAYFAKLVERDKEMREALEQGEITQQQYTQWRLTQISRGKRYEDLRDKLAERMTAANETATAYVNDTTPGVYTLNMNYSAYNIAQEYGDIGFTVWNEEAVRRLALENPDVMPYYPPQRAVNRGIDLAYGKSQITAQITSSILLGDTIYRIADKLQERISSMSRASAIRAARTAFTAAQNGGRQATFERAAEMGIRVRKKWVATKDMRTRHAHAMADGQIVDYDQPFIVGGERLMHPADGSLGASAGNLYNCRCAERSVEKEGIEAEPRMMRVRNPATGRNELVPEMTYAEWYKWKTGKDYTQKSAKIASKENQYKNYLRGLKNKQISLRSRQKKVFSAIPNVGDWAELRNKQISIEDLAALTAYTGHEFALFGDEQSKVVVHGGASSWNIPYKLWEKIQKEQLVWIAHSHPTFERLTSSAEDRKTLKLFTWQTKSIIIDLNGNQIEFTSSEAAWFDQILGVK